jgi:hypothetical protein
MSKWTGGPPLSAGSYHLTAPALAPEPGIYTPGPSSTTRPPDTAYQRCRAALTPQDAWGSQVNGEKWLLGQQSDREERINPIRVVVRRISESLHHSTLISSLSLSMDNDRGGSPHSSRPTLCEYLQHGELFGRYCTLSDREKVRSGMRVYKTDFFTLH